MYYVQWRSRGGREVRDVLTLPPSMAFFHTCINLSTRSNLTNVL